MTELKEIFVSSFGKLQNFKLTPSDGLNVIKGKNGFGKTTLAAFVQAVFFGLGGSRKSDNARRRYTPWESTSKFGGYIVFETNGKTYRAERYFGKTPAGDEFRLFDGAGAPCFDFGEELGFELFGLDADSFERCVYVPQKDVQISANDTFLTKLGKMVDDTDDQNNFETACSRLDEYQRKLTSAARSRNASLKAQEEAKLSAARMKAERLRSDLMQAERKKAERNSVAAQEEKLRQELAELKEKQKVFDDSRAAASRAEVFLQVKSRYDAAKARRDELKAKNADVDEAYVARMEEKIKKCEEMKTAANVAVGKKPLILLLCYAAAILCASAALFLVSGVVAGVACIGVGLGGFGAAIGGFTATTKKKRAALEAAFANAQNELKQEFARHKIYEDNFYASLTQLKNDKKTFEEANAAFSAAAAEFDAKSKDPLYAYAPPAAEDLSGRIAEKEDVLLRVSRENARMGAEIDALLNSSDSMSDLKNVIDGCEKRIAELEDAARIAGLAKDCLQKAKSNLSVSFMPKIKQSFERYMSFLTDGEYASASVDEKFALRLEEKNSFREFDFFSKGTTDAGLFCLRLALSDAMFGKPPFLLLDDPFVNYDGKKLAKATELLQNKSKECQIFYLTCKD